MSEPDKEIGRWDRPCPWIGAAMANATRGAALILIGLALSSVAKAATSGAVKHL